MNKLCDNCIKADVCKFKEEYMKAVKDIQAITERKNVFIKTNVSCEKWREYQITSRGEVKLGQGIPVKMG